MRRVTLIASPVSIISSPTYPSTEPMASRCHSWRRDLWRRESPRAKSHIPSAMFPPDPMNPFSFTWGVPAEMNESGSFPVRRLRFDGLALPSSVGATTPCGWKGSGRTWPTSAPRVPVLLFAHRGISVVVSMRGSVSRTVLHPVWLEFDGSFEIELDTGEFRGGQRRPLVHRGESLT